MTDKVQKIRAEIERRMKASAKIEEEYKGIDKDLSAKAQLKAAEYQSMLVFIDSLQEEPVSDDLKEAAIVYNKKANFVCAGEIPNEHFIAGARWQKQQDQETIELAEDHAMLAGMEKMKEQMMAKAIDGDITFDYYGDDDKTYGCIAHDSFCLEDFGLKDTDKVKMILIKED